MNNENFCANPPAVELKVISVIPMQDKKLKIVQFIIVSECHIIVHSPLWNRCDCLPVRNFPDDVSVAYSGSIGKGVLGMYKGKNTLLRTLNLTVH